MDRRKFQRVALPVGLLFCMLLIVFTEGILFWRAGIVIQKEEQRQIGALIKEYPELEPEVIKSLSEDLDSDETLAAVKLGRELEEKYGYDLKDSRMYEIYRFYMFGAVLVLAAGALVCFVFVRKSVKEAGNDREEKNRLEESLQETRRHAERTKEKLNWEEQETKKLITDISHQLKTPIAALKMSYEIADSTELSREEEQEFAKKEREEVGKLEELLDSFMHLAKLETKMIRIQPKESSLKEILTRAVGSIYMKAYQKKIDIALEEFPDRTVWSDARWTEEVFVNILDNAVKYSPEHTVIHIRVTELVSYMMVEIEDQGPGISQEEAGLIFQRFYRGTESGDVEGSGVGLYLARKILEEQGGTICVKPGRETGSCFVMTIPKEA